MSEAPLSTLIKNGKTELVDAPYIQKKEEILNDNSKFNFTKAKLYSLLDYIEELTCSSVPKNN